MSEKIGFDPRQSTHAIERCSANIAFGEMLPERIFSTIRSKVSDSAKSLGLNPAPMISLRVNAASGEVVPFEEADNNMPVSFVSPDQAVQLFIAPNSISWATSRYIRWRPFIGEMSRALSNVIDEYLNAVTPKAIRLDYVDSFFWTGTWDDFDHTKLLKKDSGMLAARPRAGKREWHTHTGWFSPVGKFRRLTAANVDVKEGPPPGGLIMKPSVVITTVMQDEINIPGYGTSEGADLNKEFIFERFEDLHTGLKGLLKDIVVEPMADRIGLLEK